MEHRCLSCKFLEVNMSNYICYCSAGGCARRIEFYNPNFVRDHCFIEYVKQKEEAIKPKYELGQQIFIIRDNRIVPCKISNIRGGDGLYWDWFDGVVVYYLEEIVPENRPRRVYSHIREGQIYLTREECEVALNV